TPSSTQPGGSLSIEGYAFSSSGVANVTWVWNDGNQSVMVQSVANTTTNSLGEFTAKFTVPSWVAGGTYVINASTNHADPTAYDTFTVTPTMSLSRSTAPLGAIVTATASGLGNYTKTASIVTSYSPYSTTSVTLGHDAYDVGFAYDNVQLFGGTPATAYVTASTVLQAAGYPMVHYVQLYNASTSPYSLIISLPLNVTGTTNTEAATASALSAMNSTLGTVSSQVSSVSSTLTMIQGTLTNMQGSLTSLQTAVGNLGSTLSSDYNSLSSSLSSVSSSLSSMGSTLSSISSQVGTIGSSLSSVSSTLSTVQAEAAQISSINSLVLATIVIAIIILVLEIVVLVRRR
ncbi:MAG: hypothetical protein ACP5ID_06315, partial [Conexivisphaera sp.]